MTIASVIITDAYRESNLIPVGQSETTAEQTEALRRLNRIIDRLISTAAGELVYDWLVPPSPTAPTTGQVRNPRDPYGDRTQATVYKYPVILIRS